MTSQTPQTSPTLMPDGSGQAAGAPPAEEASSTKARGRRWVVWAALVGALLLAAVAAGGYFIVTRMDAPAQSSAWPTPFIRPAATTGGSGTQSPAGSPTVSASLADSPATGGRNPFQVPAGAAAATTAPGPTTAVADGSTSSGGSGGATVTTTATATATASSTYVGLYAFSGSQATFWVNDTKYEVSEGSSFGEFTYRGQTSSSCAEVVAGGGTSTTICVGNVKQLG